MMMIQIILLAQMMNPKLNIDYQPNFYIFFKIIHKLKLINNK